MVAGLARSGDRREIVGSRLQSTLVGGETMKAAYRNVCKRHTSNHNSRGGKRGPNRQRKGKGNTGAWFVHVGDTDPWFLNIRTNNLGKNDSSTARQINFRQTNFGTSQSLGSALSSKDQPFLRPTARYSTRKEPPKPSRPPRIARCTRLTLVFFFVGS